MIVRARRHGDARHDGERTGDALVQGVDAGVELPAVLQLPVIVDMPVAGLPEPVVVEEEAQRRMRTQLLEASQRLRAEAAVEAGLDLAEAAGAAEEADLRVEVAARLRVSAGDRQRL